MKRKPDLMWILAIVLGLGIVTTGYTKSLWERSSSQATPSPYEVQSMLAPSTSPDQ